ncbi:peptidyl-prolyl cis-trans isomerase D [Thiohalospira halophila DSM 15071]|uniref:Periplasmic chaperone PpiD n=1 Tax=Thiohalospira halophila DSM 15071 TaxID=1123397 RepID=A0A1I1P6D2_9GAMM|nr:SurA N-terminal domain-containing protein [Thiohalospira halophila]SFD05285.1 peptidyl-prolyl cis-trans isomerase D [Thiohalospira halophila DSM 15071]
MLDAIRSRAQGWIAWVIVILITIPFALWGVQEYTGGGGPPSVAEVDGQSIARQEFQRAFYQRRQQLQEVLGEDMAAAGFDEATIREQVLQGMVEERVLLGALRDAGYTIGDRELASRIRAVRAFQEGGDFSRERYEQALSSQGMLPGQFEDRVRQDLLVQQLRAGVEETALATPRQVDDYIALWRQRREVGWLRVPLSEFADPGAVAQEDIRAHYESHAERYRTPEQVRIAYVELTMDDVAEDIEIDEEALREEYEARQDEFGEPERRRARHILFTAQGSGDQGWEEARAEAEAVLEELDEGKEFADLAREHSEDRATASEGGDLGWFTRDDLDPAVTDAAFGLERGEVAGPVRSEFGYHLIRLEEVDEAEVPPFAEVRDELARSLRQGRAERRFVEATEELANLAYEHADTLQPAADSLGLEIRETGPFGRESADEGLASKEPVVQAAFGGEVLEERYNSQLLELSDDRVAVLRVREHQPAQRRPLEEVSDRIRETLARDRAAEAAEERATELREELASGAEPEALPAWQGPRRIGRRGDGEIPEAVTRSAFRIARPGEGASFETTTLGDGDRAVIGVFRVIPGDPEGLEEGERQRIQRQLVETNARTEFAGVVGSLREQADISINLERE